jgi:hypothetical protein
MGRGSLIQFIQQPSLRIDLPPLPTTTPQQDVASPSKVKTPKKERKEKGKDKEGKKKKEKSKRGEEEGVAAAEDEQPKVCVFVSLCVWQRRGSAPPDRSIFRSGPATDILPPRD